MAKLLLALCLTLVIQHAFSEYTLKNIKYVNVPDDVETSAGAYRTPSSSNYDAQCKLDRSIPNVLDDVAALVLKHQPRNSAISKILNEMLYTCTNYWKLSSTTLKIKTTCIRRLIHLNTALLIHLSEEPNNNEDLTRAQVTLENLLRSLQTRLNTCKTENINRYRNDNNNEENLNLPEILQKLNYNDPVAKNTLDHIVAEYFKNLAETKFSLKPNFLQYPSSFTIEQTLNFIVNAVQTLPERSSVAFQKATVIFEQRLVSMIETNTPLRQLVFRLHALSDSVTSPLELLPENDPKITELVGVLAREFQKALENLVKNVEAPESRGFAEHLNVTAKTLQEDQSARALIVSIQKSTYEMHKWILTRTNASEFVQDVTHEFLEALQIQAKLVGDVAFKTEYVELWSALLHALPNRLSMYFRGEVDYKTLGTTWDKLKQTLSVLKTLDDSLQNFSNLTQQVEEGRLDLNGFLQDASLKIDTFLWKAYKEKGYIPNNVKKALLRYFITIDYEMHQRYRITRGLQVVQTLPEIEMAMQDVADRLTKMLHIRIPGFKHQELAYRVYSYEQMLDVATFQLKMILDNAIVRKVHDNLRQIKHNLRNTIEHADLDMNVQFSIYMQDTIKELGKLVFTPVAMRQHLTVLLSDFLFSLNHIQNQIQFDFEMVTKEHDVKTINIQIQSVSGLIATFVQRSQFKPLLKTIVLKQIQVLSSVVKNIYENFQNNNTYPELSAKYNEMHKDLLETAEHSENALLSKLSATFLSSLQNITEDLQRLAYLKQHESPEFHALCRQTLVVLSNIMVRMQNVHYYEYFHFMTNNKNMLTQIQNYSHLITEMLESFPESDENKNDLAIHAFRYSHRLEKVSGRLELEAGVRANAMINVMDQLQTLATQKTSIKLPFAQLVLASANEMANIVQRETSVGATHSIIKLNVAAEKLYMHLVHILAAEKAPKTLRRVSGNIDSHVHYLSKALEQVNFDNANSVAVLQRGLESVLEFVKTRFSGMQNLDRYSGVYGSKINYGNSLRVVLATYAQRVALVMKELAWTYPETNTTSNNTQNIFEEFVAVIQRVQIDIESKVLLKQSQKRVDVLWPVVEKSAGVQKKVTYLPDKDWRL